MGHRIKIHYPRLPVTAENLPAGYDLKITSRTRDSDATYTVDAPASISFAAVEALLEAYAPHSLDIDKVFRQRTAVGYLTVGEYLYCGGARPVANFEEAPEDKRREPGSRGSSWHKKERPPTPGHELLRD